MTGSVIPDVSAIPLMIIAAVMNWDHVAFIILMILMRVAAIDYVSARVRVIIIGPLPKT